MKFTKGAAWIAAAVLLLAFPLFALITYHMGLYELSFINRGPEQNEQAESGGADGIETQGGISGGLSTLPSAETDPDASSGTDSSATDSSEQETDPVIQTDITPTKFAKSLYAYSTAAGYGFTVDQSAYTKTGQIITRVDGIYNFKNAYSLTMVTKTVAKEVALTHGGIGVKYVEETVARPQVELYGGYIIFDNEGALSLLDPAGVMLVPDLGGYEPAFFRDEENRPIFTDGENYAYYDSKARDLLLLNSGRSAFQSEEETVPETAPETEAESGTETAGETEEEQPIPETTAPDPGSLQIDIKYDHNEDHGKVYYGLYPYFEPLVPETEALEETIPAAFLGNVTYVMTKISVQGTRSGTFRPAIGEKESADITVEESEPEVETLPDETEEETEKETEKRSDMFGGLDHLDKDDETDESETIESETLEGETLEGETLEGETLEGETLEGETLEGETLEGETLEGETLEGETLESETLEGETLEGETLEGETLEGETLEGETTAESETTPESETAAEATAPEETEPATEPESTEPAETEPLETTEEEAKAAKKAAEREQRIQENGGLWGYKDAKGNVVIPAQYLKAYNFNANGLAAAVTTDGTLIFIDRYGSTYLDAYKMIFFRRERYAYDGWYPPESYGEENLGMFYFDSGLVRVRRRIIDTTYENYVFVDESVLIDSSGREFNIPTGYTLEAYSEGVLLLSKDGRYGYMDITGRWIADPIYTYARPFHEGLAVVGFRKTKVGMIDRNGDFIVPAVYDYISDTSSGIIAAYDGTVGWQIFAKLS